MPSRLSAPSCFDQKLSPASCFPSPHHYLNCSHQRSHDQDDHHTSATDRKIEDNEIIDDLDTRTQVMKIVEREPKKPQQQNHHLQHRLHHVIRDDGRQSENVKKWVRTVRTKLIVFQRGLHRSQKPAVMCRPVVVYNVEAEKELTQSLTAELAIDEPTLAPLITTVDRQQDHLLQYEVQQAAKLSTSSATNREAPVVVVPPPPPPVVVPAPPAPPPPPPSPPPMPAISKEEVAALKIQSAFRGHLARRAFRALRGLVRLQAVVRGYSVRKQTCYALNCMHSMVRLQVRVRGRQLLMSSATTPTASPHVPAPHRK